MRPLLFALLALACTPRSVAPPRPATTTADACAASPAPTCAMPPPNAPDGRGDRNVLGAPIAPCGTAPRTGWRRTGRCDTGPDDTGVHVVCATLTDDFLRFTVAQGNDLVTPHPEAGFPGLRAGDRWCLCASRWVEAERANVAPPVVLDATHEAALRFTSIDRLRASSAGAASAPDARRAP